MKPPMAHRAATSPIVSSPALENNPDSAPKVAWNLVGIEDPPRRSGRLLSPRPEPSGEFGVFDDAAVPSRCGCWIGTPSFVQTILTDFPFSDLLLSSERLCATA